MHAKLMALALIAAVWAAPLQAQEEERPALTLDLAYDEYFDNRPELNLQEEISLDLIDIDAIRAVLNAQRGRDILRLSLEDCVRIALEQNNDILIASYDTLGADSGIDAAKGEFDPVWQSEFNFLDAATSTSQQTRVFGNISSVETFRTTTSTGISGKLHSGTLYDLSFLVNREETTFGRFVQDYDATLRLTITQPILRGAGFHINRVRIRQAENTKKISDAQFQLTLLNAVADLVRAYWDHVGAIETLNVQHAALENADRLLEIQETRNKIGMTADIEVVQAQAGVIERQGDFFAARSRIEDAGDVLKQIMALETDARIIPLNRPGETELPPLDPDSYKESLDRSIERALELRPETKMTALEIENARLEEMRAKNEMLPQLDVTGSYNQGGRNEFFGDSLSGLADRQDDAYTIGFRFSVPIGNRTARSNHRRSQASRQAAQQRQHQTLQALTFNVGRAARSVMTNKVLVKSNEQSRLLQEVLVLAEERKAEAGVTTSFQVLQIQEQLTAAFTQEVQARIAHEKALIDLQLAEGTLLDNLGIDIAPPENDGVVGYWESILPTKESYRPHW